MDKMEPISLVDSSGHQMGLRLELELSLDSLEPGSAVRYQDNQLIDQLDTLVLAKCNQLQACFRPFAREVSKLDQKVG